MGARKIVNESEVIRWFEEGRTYEWMTNEYRRKYNIEMTSSSWGNFRRRRGLARRIVRNDELIPWYVKREHRHDYNVTMLRAEARRRAGKPIAEMAAQRLESWKRKLEEANAVVHYDPDTEQGFFLVPRQKGDDDLIHRPKKATTLRKAAD